MKGRAYRRYMADKIALKRWWWFERPSEFTREIFPYLGCSMWKWWSGAGSFIGRYRKWNGHHTRHDGKKDFRRLKWSRHKKDLFKV